MEFADSWELPATPGTKTPMHHVAHMTADPCTSWHWNRRITDTALGRAGSQQQVSTASWQKVLGSQSWVTKHLRLGLLVLNHQTAGRCLLHQAIATPHALGGQTFHAHRPLSYLWLPGHHHGLPQLPQPVQFRTHPAPGANLVPIGARRHCLTLGVSLTFKQTAQSMLWH